MAELLGALSGSNDMTDSFNLFPNFLPKFRAYLAQQHVIVTVVAFIIGLQIEKFMTKFFDNMVSPIFDLIFGTLNALTGGKTSEFSNLKIKIMNAEFGIGETINSFVKLVIVLFVAFWISNITQDILN
jgi:large-conductance mechanosensitive channel